MLNEQGALEAQLEQVLNAQWATNEMNKFIRCLDDAGFAKKAGVEISIQTEGTNGQFVRIAPPQQGISPEDLKRYRDMVRSVLKNQQAEYEKSPVNFDQQIQSIGQKMQSLAKRSDIDSFDFNQGLQKARAKARSFEWSDSQHKIKVSMFQTPANGQRKPNDERDEYEQELARERLKQEQMRMRKMARLHEERDGLPHPDRTPPSSSTMV